MSTSSNQLRDSDSLVSSAVPGVTGAEPRVGASEAGPLSLRVVRGPLKPDENESILAQYNSLTGSSIPSAHFLRWVKDAPEGAAWHALLENGGGEIVGHTCLIPLCATHAGRSLIAAKSEYSFIREKFRAAKIRGFEQTGRLKNLVYIDELFRRCRSEGWSPLLISTPQKFHRVFRSIKCYPVEFPLWECLLVLRPQEASRNTPNLRGWQRAVVWGAGVLQSAWWSSATFFSRNGDGIQHARMAERRWETASALLSFFDDQESLAWRYPESEYARMVLKDGGELIVKDGTTTSYLRVCQARRSLANRELVVSLVKKALAQKALGVRWSMYGEDESSSALVSTLRKLGFLCVRRVRTLLVNSAEEAFLKPETWNLTDAMFSFDH